MNHKTGFESVETWSEHYALLYYFIECGNDSDDGVVGQPITGYCHDSVTGIDGGILNQAILAAIRLQAKDPNSNFDKVPTSDFELLAFSGARAKQAEGTDTTEIDAETKKSKTKKPDMSPEARAMAVLADNPTWNITQIAKEANVDRQRLYEMPTFMAARKIQQDAEKDSYKKRIPKGSKDNETGDIEAWQQ